jgi:hypothetical protein
VVTSYWWRPVRRLNKVDVAVAIARRLDERCELVLEGDLANCRAEIEALPGVAWLDIPADRMPKQPTGSMPDGRWSWRPVERRQRASLPLNHVTIEDVTRRILPRIGIVERVSHLVFLDHGSPLVWAYDNWHPDCLGASVEAEPLLRELAEDGVIEAYESFRNP